MGSRRLKVLDDLGWGEKGFILHSALISERPEPCKIVEEKPSPLGLGGGHGSQGYPAKCS